VNADAIRHFRKVGADGSLIDDGASEWDAALDKRTGLMWPARHIEVPNWNACESAAKKLRVAGFDDWTVPEVEPLFCLADRTRFYPAIDTRYFIDCPSDWFYSRTTRGDCAFGVNFGYGGASWSHHYSLGFLRAVRVGQP